MSHRILGLAVVAVVGAAWTGRAGKMVYEAQMVGAEETPSRATKGNGMATLTMDGNKIHWKLQVHDMSATPTMAHIHVGAAGVAGPPVYTFKIYGKPDSAGTLGTGTIDLIQPTGATISGDSLKKLLNSGHAYVNVHTKTFPDGEIRGQLKMKM